MSIYPRYLHDLDAEEDELIATRRALAQCADDKAAIDADLAALKLDLAARAREALAQMEGKSCA